MATYKIGMKAVSWAAMSYGYNSQEKPWTIGSFISCLYQMFHCNTDTSNDGNYTKGSYIMK